MEALTKGKELPTGLCQRKFQSLAFVCPEAKFEFQDFLQLKCWRVDGNVIGLARLPKSVRNGVWRKMLPAATWYVLEGRNGWVEIENACRRLDVFEDRTQRQAYNDAKRALQIFMASGRRSSMQKLVRTSFRSYLAGLRMMA